MIIFLILAHYAEDVLQDQIDNIKKLVPNSKVVLYNGGLDPDFGRSCGVDICPYSQPVQKPKLARVLIETMMWLEEEQCSYDYLVYMDSDMLFTHRGYDQRLDELMDGYDGMALYMRKVDKDTPDLWWAPARDMWNEWERWKPFFGTEYFMGCLNAMQVYRKSLIQKMLAALDYKQMIELIHTTEVYALEEILVPTLAASCGGKLRAYPKMYEKYVRLDAPLAVQDVREAREEKALFAHPIERELDNPARVWIREQLERSDAHIDERSPDSPLISIVIPCYNYGQYLDETIQSCLNSSFQDFEIIVVNDGSNDPATIQKLHQLNDPKTKVIHQRNQGLAAARNTGIKEAAGTYVFPLDADDRIHPTLLEKGYWVLERYPRLGFVTTWLKHFGNESWVWSPPPYNFYSLLHDNNIVGNSLIRRSAWEAVGGYDESMRGGYEDWDFWIKLSEGGWTGYQIQEPLFFYRKHGSSMLQQSNTKREELKKQIRDNHPYLHTSHFIEELRNKWETAPPKLPEPLPWEHVRRYEARRGGEANHIMLILPWLTVGGAEKVALDMMKGLHCQGYRFTVVTTLDSTNPWQEVFEDLTCDIFHLPRYALNGQMEDALIQLIEARGIHIVHINNSELGYVSLTRIKSRFSHIKTLSLLHAYVPSLPWDYVRKAAHMDTYLDHHIVIKPSIKQVMINKLAIAPDKVTVIPNGVDIERYKPTPQAQKLQLRQQRMLPGDSFIITFLGRLAQDKAPERFIRVCERIAALHPELPLRFHLIGDGPLHDSVLASIQESKYRHQFACMGHCSDIEVQLAISDLLVNTSPSEGLPIAGLEAMAAGVPIAAFSVPGWNELLEHRATGMLAPYSSSSDEGMVQVIDEYIQSAELRERIQVAARNVVVERYSSHKFHSAYAQCYREVTASKHDSSTIRQTELDTPEPLVTVVITSYNSKAYLNKAIESVMKQTSKQWKLLMIDDGSSDGSDQLMQQLHDGDRYMFIPNAVNMGQTYCLNKALSYTTTPYLLQLDSDDWLEPQAIELILKAFDTAPKHVAVLGGHLRILAPHGNEWIQHGASISSPLELLLLGTSVWPRCYRTRHLQEVGGWSTDLPYESRFVEDANILVKLTECYRMECLDHVLYNHLRHASNLTNQVKETSQSYEWVIHTLFERRYPQLKPIISSDHQGYSHLWGIARRRATNGRKRHTKTGTSRPLLVQKSKAYPRIKRKSREKKSIRR
ncbi:glycosyltransferase [Paenibacillus sp. YYML68]|uniref:glycosyltransferase n=1 Tax=Paenibacillus sp. YYML68 TaxID=2909250 RepID=UPI002492CF45|nr:glycosyltransferase [Paenibacillus sp. YYML68]